MEPDGIGTVSARGRWLPGFRRAMSLHPSGCVRLCRRRKNSARHGAFKPNGATNGALAGGDDPAVGAGASFGTTSKAPRIHGWMRQKYAYLPGARSGGDVETPLGLPSEIGSQPRIPESKRPSASG